MALIPGTLQETLTAAYAAALTDFIAVIKTSPLGDASGAANLTAAVASSSAVFGTLAGTAIDAYIRTAQVSPGQVVTTTGSAVAQTGATTTPGVLV